MENHARELETLKVRQAQLFDADIETLRKIFERQAEALNLELDRARGVIRERNQEIEKLLHEKHDLRKQMEQELDSAHSHKDSVQMDFKNQLVQKDREMRASVTKVEMVSQGLIKDNDMAQAKTRMLESENSKLKSIIDDRNKEIAILNEKNDKLLKDLHD